MCQPPVCDADGTIIDRGGFPHPLRDQLDALVYPAWQLVAATPRLPQVRPRALLRRLHRAGGKTAGLPKGHSFGINCWQLQGMVFALAVAYS